MHHSVCLPNAIKSQKKNKKKSLCACRNYLLGCLDLRVRAYSARGFVILCAQYCNPLARCVHALALFCPTFNTMNCVIKIAHHMESD